MNHLRTFYLDEPQKALAKQRAHLFQHLRVVVQDFAQLHPLLPLESDPVSVSGFTCNLVTVHVLLQRNTVSRRFLGCSRNPREKCTLKCNLITFLCRHLRLSHSLKSILELLKRRLVLRFYRNMQQCNHLCSELQLLVDQDYEDSM